MSEKTHADEARRLWDRHRSAYIGVLECEGWGDVDPVAEIAAALAAAERAGIKRAAKVAETWDPKCGCERYAECEDCLPRPCIASAIRALLPAAVAEPAHTCSTGPGGVCLHPEHHPSPAEPAAKCATCGGGGVICVSNEQHGAGKCDKRPCPSCGGAR